MVAIIGSLVSSWESDATVRALSVSDMTDSSYVGRSEGRGGIGNSTVAGQTRSLVRGGRT